jgi:putative SOS response-associated peptidase YedK
MCGRYALWGVNLLGGRFLIVDPTLGFRSHFNIAPGSANPVITGSPEGNHAPLMEWGLVPHWEKGPAPATRPINARAESLADRPMFRGLLAGNRCIVPANGFYEWKKTGGRKEPYFIHLAKKELFGFAGLYDTWRDPAGVTRMTYTIITTEANDLVRPVHERMPVVLRREHERRWLNGGRPGPEELEAILSPYPAEGMALYPVSPAVNAATGDGEDLVRPQPSPVSWFDR